MGGGGLIGGIVGYEWRQYREKQQEKETKVEDWFDECQNMASRGNQSVYRAVLRSEISYEAILTDLNDFADRLYVRSQDKPDNIPKKVAEDVETLSKLYSKASSVAEVNTQKEGIEVTTELFEMAQREFSSQIDFAEVMNNAGEVSEGFGHLLSLLGNQGVTTEEIAEVVEEMFEDWDSDEFAFFVAQSASSNLDVDETIDQMMRIFLQLVSQLSGMTYERLEQQKNEIL